MLSKLFSQEFFVHHIRYFFKSPHLFTLPDVSYAGYHIFQRPIAGKYLEKLVFKAYDLHQFGVIVVISKSKLTGYTSRESNAFIFTFASLRGHTYMKEVSPLGANSILYHRRRKRGGGPAPPPPII